MPHFLESAGAYLTMNFTWIKKQKTAVFSNAVLITCLASALSSLSLTSFAHAQRGSSTTSAIYGRGVHAYFAGRTSEAEKYFSQAIDSGSTDPRPYYYRAMVRLNQGRKFEAENDMRMGADYEARNPGMKSSIGRSLQRVQGPGRRTLEQFRRQARLDRLQQSQQQTQQRYQQLDRRGPSVLRSELPRPLEQHVQPPQGFIVPGPYVSEPYVPAPTEEGSGTFPLPTLSPAPDALPPSVSVPAEPMPAGSGVKEGPGATETAGDPFGTPAPVTPVDDPFGSDAFPASAPAPVAPAPIPAADPFGALPAPSAEPAVESADPFGDSTAPAPEEEAALPETTGGDDPFGASPSEETPTEAPMEEAPAEAPAETEDSEVFGEEEAAESEPPAESEADPFGDSSDSSSDSSTEPADDSDPFGDSSTEEDAESTDEVFSDEGTGEDEDTEGDTEEEAPAPESDDTDPFGDF